MEDVLARRIRLREKGDPVQKKRELAALNRLFQRHLVERSADEDKYQEVLVELESLTRQASTLAESVRYYGRSGRGATVPRCSGM